MTLDQQIEEVENKIHKMWDSFPRRDTEMLGRLLDIVKVLKSVVVEMKRETPDRKATN